MSVNPLPSCDRLREALSAMLDGEEPGLRSEQVDGHLARCRGCRDFRRGIDTLARDLRVRPAPDLPDLAPDVMTAIDSMRQESEHHPRWELRTGLLVVACVQLALAVPGLLLGHDDGASVHVARHDGAFEAAVAVGFVMGAWLPLRAWVAAVALGALSAVMVVTAGIDMGLGHTTLLDETAHLPLVIGSGLLWLLVRRQRPDRRLEGRAAR